VGAVVVVKDITQLLGLEREMTFLASYDPLTGLLNRRAFERRLERVLQAARDEGRRAALCYLDLDEFKVVNDTCGHVAGDELLKQVSALLQWRAPEHVVLARLGGDEFGILIEDRSLETARPIAEEVLREIAAFRFEWQGRAFECASSIGLVPIDPQSDDLSSVLSAADAACYVAKEAGRNRIHVYQANDEAVAERYGEMQWIHRIRKAFDEDRFVLYEQEIRPFGEGEALREIFIRMLDEEGTLVPPVAFIPAAERYHLVPQIDRWVVAHALEALARDPGGQTFTINLSGQSITQESFLDFVSERLDGAGVDPRRVCFEITETAAIAHLTRALTFINALRSRGCRFVLDDFGSGMSSFAYLKNLPVDFIKIDGEFVRDLVADPIHAALVGSIHQIGHVMGLKTIAEAVEDEPTLAALRALGVDYVQGYHVHRPQPLATFAGRVAAAAAR
jgi:diguanylate cyclase (GGDEF)-like protein